MQNLETKEEEDKYFEQQASFLLQKRKMDRIDNFNEYFDFLNNDYPCAILYSNLLFKSVSHAYQAARASEQYLKEKMAFAETPQELYAIATSIDDPENWMQNRCRIMEQLVRDKFRRHKDLRDRLKATGTRELFNTYQDMTVSNIFWGVVDNKGQNQLGRILEQVRHDIGLNIELQKWLFTSCEVQDDKNFIPKITLLVHKSDGETETVELHDKPYYLIGSLKGNDLLLAHKSVSRYHAAILVDQEKGVVLIDLASKCGCFIDDVQLEQHYPYPIYQGNIIRFAFSSRKYEFQVDYTQVEANLKIKKKNIEKDMKILEKLDNPNVSQEILLATLGKIPEDTLFVSNLTEQTSTKDLKRLFGEFGPVKDVRLPIDKVTGKLRKIAFIVFEHENDAKKALKLDKSEYQGRKINVTLSEKKTADQILYEKIEEAKKEEKFSNKRYENDRYNKDKDFQKHVRKDFEKRHEKTAQFGPLDREDQKKQEESQNQKEKSQKKRKYSESSSNSSSSSSSSSISSSESRSRHKKQKNNRRRSRSYSRHRRDQRKRR